MPKALASLQRPSLEGASRWSCAPEEPFLGRKPTARGSAQRLQCESGDSNPDPLRDWILSPARLPIPPLSQCRPGFCFSERRPNAHPLEAPWRRQTSLVWGNPDCRPRAKISGGANRSNRSKGIAKSRSECPHHRTFPNTVYFSVKFPVKGSNSGRCGWDCQRTGFFLPNQTSHYGTESPEEPTGRTSACRFRPGKSDAVWGVRYPQWTTQRFDLHLWQWPLSSE